MFDLQTLYDRSPIWMQNLAVTLKGRQVVRERFGHEFQRQLAAAERRFEADHDRLCERRDADLAAFVRESFDAVPFYRQRFALAGVDPASIRGLEDLGRMPVLTKQEVRESGEAFARRDDVRNALTRCTGGSTASPLVFRITAHALREQWAVWWRYWRWHGLEPGTWSAVLAGHYVVPARQRRPPFWRVDAARRSVLFSSFHLSPDTAPAYVSELRRRRLPWLHGYPSTLASLAGYIRDLGLDPGYRPIWITTGSESLLPEQRELLRDVFGVWPRQHYGLAEGTANLSECEHGRLHVDEDFAAVEFLPNPDGPGLRIVGCNLSNPASPFLRYDSGDLAAAVHPAGCPCGRPGRLVDAIDGRIEDIVLLADGTRLGRVSAIFRHLHGIQAAQIHQRRPGAITVRVVRAADFAPEHEAALRHAAHARLGADLEITVVYVDALERSPNGKVRLVISELAGGKVRNDDGPTRPTGE